MSEINRPAKVESKLIDPVFDEDTSPTTFESTASLKVGMSAPLSPITKQPMRLFTSRSSGREIKMWGDIQNRIVYPASEAL